MAGWLPTRNLMAGAAISVLLTGCGIPPALTIATTVADGFSYAVSGKGMTDHALSAFTTDDCALVRMLDERDICTGYAGEELPRVLTVSAPAVGSWGRVESVVSSGRSVAGGTSAVAPALPIPSLQQRSALFASASPEKNSGAGVGRTGVVTVLGSYHIHDNAKHTLSHLASLNPRIVTATAAGRTIYRVVSDVPVQQAKVAGVADAWPVLSGSEGSGIL